MRALLACLAFVGCVNVRRPFRVPEPTSADNGGIVLSVAVREGHFKTHYARYAAVARVNSRGKLEEGVVSSNYFKDDLVYILDLPPGLYAPVSGAYLYNGLKNAFAFDARITTAASVAVTGGRLSFAGDVTTKIEKTGRSRLAVFSKVDRGRAAELAALTAAGKALAGTLWEEGVDRQRMLIGAPETPVLDSKDRVAAPVATARFTYADALGWKGPVKITGGLEWHEPQGRARVALTFLAPGMDGYMDKDQYLKYMRSVGAPEDDHRIDEVVFSSHPAYQVAYTTYYYPKGTLVGSLVKVYRTKTLMVPETDGLYFLHYRAETAYYERFYGDFTRFRDTIRLVGAPKAP